MTIRNFAQLLDAATERAPKRVAIVGAGQRQTLRAARLARGMKLAHCILIDDPERVRAIAEELERAGVRPDEVDYINTHGTSTPAGDRVEVVAIKRVFGEHARKLASASTKSMTGHLLGAAGGLETAVTALAVYHDVVPPTINQENPDPECDLDCVPNASRKMTVRRALNNSFGFGGTNATVLLSKHQD